MSAETAVEVSQHPPEGAAAIRTNCCDAWWTGVSAAHCASCHQTFTGVKAFVAHRVKGACRAPEQSGLVPAAKRWPGWGFPGSWNGPEADG